MRLFADDQTKPKDVLNVKYRPIKYDNTSPELFEWKKTIIQNGGYVDRDVLKIFDIFIKNCKTDGIWNKILDCAFFVGLPNLNSIRVKLKTPTGVSRILENVNSNFINTDYISTGSTSGLIGNGSNKSLNTFTPRNINSLSSASYGVYTTTSLSGAAIGARTGATVIQLSSVAGDHIHFGNPGRVDFGGNGGVGMFSGSSSNSDIRIVKNGSFVSNSGSAGTNWSEVGIDAYKIFEQGNNSQFSLTRITHYFIGVGLTDQEQIFLHNHVNTIMTTFGCNVY